MTRLVTQATDLTRRGAFDEARSILSRIVELEPNWLPGLLEYGGILQRLGQYHEGVAALDRAFDLAPDDWRVAFALGGGLHNADRVAEAARMFRRASVLAPDQPTALAHLCDSEQRSGRPGAALAGISWLLCLAPHSFQALALKAVCLANLSRYDEAIVAAGRSLLINPAAAGLERHLAISHSQRANNNKALIALRRTCQLAPEWDEAWLDLAGALFGERDYARAEHAVRRALDLGAAPAESHFLLARILWAMDRRDHATEQFKQAVALDPARDLDAKIALLTTTSMDFAYRD